jgi:acyl-CoA synthetase (AMP-forming)/AMP-acid ligase II
VAPDVVLPDPVTIPALLAHRRRAGPDRRALVSMEVDGAAAGGAVRDDGAGAGRRSDGGVRAVTYAELDDESAGLAARLVAAGVVKGDRVGLVAPNGIAWATTATAVLRIGAVLVPLSTLLRPPELLAQLATARATHLIAAPAFRDRRYLDDLEVAAPGLLARVAHDGGRHPALPSLRRVWRTDGLPQPAAPADLVRAMEARVRSADDMVVLFTSGSRGAPKGTIHTHGGALRATAAGLDARCVRPGERLYIPMPFFWTGGFSGGLLTALVAGATLLTEAEPEPSRTLRLLRDEGATLFRGWPDQAARLAAHPDFAATDLSSLGPGSLPAVLPADRRPAPGARANLFGMTESFGPYCGDRLDTDLPAAKFGSCGRPFAGVEVRVVEPESGAEVAPGEQGEIRLRGPNLLRGICGRLRSSVFTPDGFLPTGDLGRLDADGYLWYLGRLDDMVKVKGATVYPSEVEAALRSVEAVRQAHVTDVAGASGRPEIGALVVTEAPAPAVVAEARARLSAFKVPTRWLLTGDAGDVPATATGKVDKARLQRLLLDRGAPAPGPPVGEDPPSRGERTGGPTA